jgi:glycine cleavage system aminomethyltransferase T
MMDSDFSAEGTKAVVDMPSGQLPVVVVPKPFYDPKKGLAGAAL